MAGLALTTGSGAEGGDPKTIASFRIREGLLFGPIFFFAAYEQCP
jgi:hypothetical protein